MDKQDTTAHCEQLFCEYKMSFLYFCFKNTNYIARLGYTLPFHITNLTIVVQCHEIILVTCTMNSLPKLM